MSVGESGRVVAGPLHRRDEYGGQPQALTVVDAQRILAATQDSVYESQDGGSTFTGRLTVFSGNH